MTGTGESTDVLEWLDRVTVSPGDRNVWKHLIAVATSALEEDRLETLIEPEAAAPTSTGRLAAWAILLSVLEPDDMDKLDSVRQRALAFAERAMVGHRGPQMAVRSARLREELGLDSAEAWAEAARREPLVAWAFPHETAGAAGVDAVDLMRQLSLPDEREAARGRLVRVAARSGAPDAALIAAAMEDIADLCARRADEGVARVRGYQSRLIDRTAAQVLEGLLAVLDGSDTRSPLAVFFEEPDVARTVTHALRAMMHGQAVDARALLREAWLEAMIDPVVALAEPRSALSKLRTAFITLSLVSAISSAASTVHAEEPSEGGGAATEQQREDLRSDPHRDDLGGAGRNATQASPWSRHAPTTSPWSR